VIVAENLTKRYGTIEAIRNVSFDAPKGEIVGLLGPNGAGKTTTMRILTCFMPPSEGTARIAGFDVLTHPFEVRRQIGYMPENPPIYHEMTVSSFLRFVAQLKEVPAKDIAKHVEQAMEKVAISHVRGRIIGHLSRGYRQRVGLAQALVHNPKILILDEPTLGLDPSQIIEIRELIRELAGEHTVILSSHILSEVQATCSYLVIIHNGKIVAKDTLKSLTQGQCLFVRLKDLNDNREEFIRNVQKIEKVTQVTPGKSPENQPLLQINFEENAADSVSEKIFEMCSQNHWILLEITKAKTSLEEIFLKMTTGDPS